MTGDTTSAAFAACEAQAHAHYENFPTASRLLAAPQRRATAVIYSFARTADDIVDEGRLDKDQRHRLLDEFESRLQQIKTGILPADGLFRALALTIRDFDLPFAPFESLFSAFRDDIDVQRYASFVQLQEYCRRSANPIGELVLRLHGHCNEQNLAYSDQICTALQLINFLQDLDSDYQIRGRLYIPLDELQSAGAHEYDIAQRTNSPVLQKLVGYQLGRAEAMLYAGVPLLRQVDWRLRQVLRLTILGGLRIVEKLHLRESIYARPVLTKPDLFLLILRGIYSSNLSARDKIRQ